MKILNMRLLPFLFLVTFIISGVGQERLTDFESSGSYADLYTVEYHEEQYLIRITQCDLVEVFRIDKSSDYTFQHSMTIEGLFGLSFFRSEFTNEFMIVPTLDNQIGVYDFVNNVFSQTEVSDPWSYTGNVWDVNNNRLVIILSANNGEDNQQILFDVNSGIEFLPDSLSISNGKEDFFVNKHFDSQGVGTFYLYNHATKEQYLLNKSEFEERQLWYDEHRLFYFNQNNSLESFNIQDLTRTTYDRVHFPSRQFFKFLIQDEKIIVSNKGEVTIYDLETQVVIGSKIFPHLDGNYISIVDYVGDVFVGGYSDRAMGFWNTKSDEFFYSSGESLRGQKVHRLVEDKSLIRFNHEESDSYQLAFVSHDDLSIEYIDGLISGHKIDGYSVSKKDSVIYMLGNYGLPSGGYSVFEVDINENRVLRNSDFDNTNAGFDYNSELGSLGETMIVLKKYGQRYEAPSIAFNGRELVPIDSFFLDNVIYQNDKVYKFSREENALFSYDGNNELVIDLDDYDFENNKPWRLSRFADYENAFIFLNESDDKIYGLNKDDFSQILISDSYVEDLVKVGEWTFFFMDDSLYRLDSNFSLLPLLDYDYDFIDAFELGSNVFFRDQGGLYEIGVSGNLESSYVGGTNSSLSMILFPDLNHFVASTPTGFLHFDGVDYLEYTKDRAYFYSGGESSVQFVDSLYVLGPKKMIALPESVLGLQYPVIDHFSFMGNEFVLVSLDEKTVEVYQLGSDFTYRLLGSHTESVAYHARNAVVERFSEKCFILFAGKVFSFNSEFELERIEGIQSLSSDVIIKNDEVYFFGRDKTYGNQVYKWNQDFESTIVELVTPEQQTSLFPNPNDGSFQILDLTARKISKVDVSNSAGTSISSQLQDDNTILLNDARSGLYYLRILFDDESEWTSKLVVE